VRLVVCKSITVPRDFTTSHTKNFFSVQLPNRIIGMVRNDAFSEVKQYSPFNFQHFNVTKISVFADDQNVQNIKPLKMDYAKQHYIRAYNTLFTGTGRLYYDEGLAIDRHNYPNGYAQYAFNLSPDLTDDEKF